jgi:Ser/Thr protein kinase RdoA (MazF antagonist)
VITDADLAAALPLAAWGLAGTVGPLGGGMNSATALVTTATASYVAKWVPVEQHEALVVGATLAERLAGAGLVVGTPVRTSAGELAVALLGGWCTLAEFVPGEPLTGDTERDQHDMASLLALAHRETAVSVAEPFFSWLRPDLPCLDVEPWVRPAVAEAVAAFAALPPLSLGWLHTDPAPEAFRREADTVGLIDWTGAGPGPVLYDVASAVMYLGGATRARHFLATYADRGPLVDGELDHLVVMGRYRWAVQAAYFAGRISRGDLTGTDEAGNRKGLADARRGLGA